jgi:hypothetical protein
MLYELRFVSSYQKQSTPFLKSVISNENVEYLTEIFSNKTNSLFIY